VKSPFFLLLYGFFLICTTASIAGADQGCLSAIQGKAINEHWAKSLPKDCQAFRHQYLKELQLLSQDSKLFSHDLARQVLAKKTFQPPYDAILISVLVHEHNDELKKALRSRAKIETEKKIKYQYAVAALERIEGGACSPQFSDRAYDEVCRARDSAMERIEKLRGER